MLTKEQAIEILEFFDLRDQQRAMGEYLHCLEIRAVIEGIELT